MAANHHPRALTPTLRAVARFPAALPMGTGEAASRSVTGRTSAPQSLALLSVGAQGRAYGVTLGGRADRFYRPLVAPRWTRYGWWDAAGTELTVTRIL